MPRFININEVKSILPNLILQTERTQEILLKGENLIERILLPENEMESVEADLNDLYALWKKFVSMHGGVVRRPWVVEFNNGNGFIHWNYEAKTELFFRAYDSNETEMVPFSDEQ